MVMIQPVGNTRSQVLEDAIVEYIEAEGQADLIELVSALEMPPGHLEPVLTELIRTGRLTADIALPGLDEDDLVAYTVPRRRRSWSHRQV